MKERTGRKGYAKEPKRKLRIPGVKEMDKAQDLHRNLEGGEEQTNDEVKWNPSRECGYIPYGKPGEHLQE